MNAMEIDDFTICKAHCDWIIKHAQELKALFSYKSEKMISMNQTRAISSICTMVDCLNELKCYINENDQD